MIRCRFCVVAVILVLALANPRERGFAEPPKPSKLADGRSILQEEVVYGKVHGAALLADVARPVVKGGEKLPAIISVHGGRWIAGHKRDSSAIKVEQWARLGFFGMSIDYRLKACTPAPACYQDVQCAIRYVNAHAEQYGIDTQRIFLIGQSAGGHLVSLAAAMGDGPFPRTGGWEKSSNDFRAAISVAAAYDLPTLDWGVHWASPGADPQVTLAQASPNRHLKKESKPLLVMHSDNDTSVPIANALLMVEALKKAGTPHTFHRYLTMGHMGINQEVIDRSLFFIRENSQEAAK